MKNAHRIAGATDHVDHSGSAWFVVPVAYAARSYLRAISVSLVLIVFQSGFVVSLAICPKTLLAGQPKRMISYDLNHDPIAEILKSKQGATDFSFVQGDSLSVHIEPCDLLFIDTPVIAILHFVWVDSCIYMV